MEERRQQQIHSKSIIKLGILTLILSSCLFALIISRNWEQIQMLQLSDNDDYMRYHQFTSWIQEGYWYLRPIENFNPEDGELIHWSRLPDIPLAAITAITNPWLGPLMSESLAITIVPFFYLIALLLAIGFFTYRLGGIEAAKIAIFMTVVSPLITKFFPGSIDHHNIQLTLLAWIIAQVPLNKVQSRQLYTAWGQGLLISLSFWVGMENLPIIALMLLVITAVGYMYSIRFIEYTKHLCLSAVFFIALFIIINRPINEFFTIRYDAISFPYLLTLGAGYLFCKLSLLSFHYRSLRSLAPSTRYLIITVISLLPVLLLFPTLILGVFHNYPDLLKDYWLNHVIEAKSLIHYVEEDGFFNEHNYLLFIIPALVSISILPKKTGKTILYLALIISLLFPIFWQLRTIFASILIAIPLQAMFCDKLMNRHSNQANRIIILLLCFPITPILITKIIPNYINSLSANTSQTSTQEISDNGNLYKVEALINNKIENSLVLAPIEFGAPVLALTNNKIIAAPYHRNINGNSIAIELFRSTDSKFIKNIIKKKGIDFVMVGEDGASYLISQKSNEHSFLNQLMNNKAPHWLSLVEETPNGVKLYRVN
jgi:hypothetical protein